MANNRTEQQAKVEGLSPIVDLIELQEAISPNDGYLFKKDVKAAVTASGGTASADFTTNDQVVITTTANVAISIVGLQDGQVGKIIVNKAAANTVSFVGVTGSLDAQQIDKTTLEYTVRSTNSRITVTQVNNQGSDSVVSGDISFSVGNVSLVSVNLFDVVVNNNIMHFEANVTVDLTSDLSEFTMLIANRKLFDFKNKNKKIACAGSIEFDGVPDFDPMACTILDNGTTYEIELSRIAGHPSEYNNILIISGSAIIQ